MTESPPKNTFKGCIHATGEIYKWITNALVGGRGLVIVSRLGRQHGDLGARLLDELLQVDLPQFLGQLLQLLLHVLHANNRRC